MAKSSTVFSLVPGLVLCVMVMVMGILGAEGIGYLLLATGVLAEGSASPISGIFVAIILGILIRNFLPLPDTVAYGVGFAVQYALRAGIILLGLRLSLTEAVKLGAWGVPLIVACITAGLFVALFITSRSNQSRRLGTLIAAGTGICGVTAIMATAPVIKAKENEISYAVANITIFGLLGMLAYPYLANFFFAEDAVKAGLFLGTAIHDTAQVTGAALIHAQIYDMDRVIDVATITKLTRNLFIIAVIPLLSYWYFQNNDKNGQGSAGQLPKWTKLFPLFIVGFLLLSLARTVGDATAVSTGSAFGLWNPGSWESFHQFWSSIGSTYMLGIAMAGVGLSTDFKAFKGMGIRPFYIGLVAALSVGAVSLILISLFGHLVVI